MGGNNKQKYQFTWKEIKFALNAPTKDIYSKLEPYYKNKYIIIIKSKKDETNFLKILQSIMNN
jgi:hypothetical protein